MSHRVPNLDVGSSELNHLHPFYSPPRKGEADLAPSLFFSDQGGEDCTNDRKQAGGCIPNNAVNHLSWMETESEEKGAHMHAMGREPALSIDVPPGHLPFQDDEMLSWLQYPIEDTYNRSYCSEQLCEQEFASDPAEGSFLGSIPVESQKLSSTNYSLQLMEPSDSDIRVEALTADVAMTMGAHRAAGHLPQDGAEAFHRVHTTMQSSHNISPSKATDTSHSALEGLQNSGKQNALNFPFFSQRIAAMKTNLQVLGTSSGPSNKERGRQPYITQANERSSSVEKSTVTALTSFEASDMSVQGKEINQGTAKAQEKFLGPTKSDDNVGNAKKEFNPCGAAIGIETGGDVTLTSLSGGSDYSTEKSAKEAVSLSCKRKSFSAEEFECESKDIGGAASQEKVPTMDRFNSGKKTRAAEIHNQSERRRRNKINDKMKALQELIPNANKTDKASMLDEAIEYVKMLQAQLQLMSMRTGMIVPPVMMPPGMQYLSVQQRLGAAQMNMGGMDVGRGIGMGVMDGSTSAFARPAFLGQPLPGQLYHAAGYQPNGLPSVSHEVHNHMHLNDKNNASAFQQLQPVHLRRTANMHRARMQANSDLQKQQ